MLATSPSSLCSCLPCQRRQRANVYFCRRNGLPLHCRYPSKGYEPPTRPKSRGLPMVRGGVRVMEVDSPGTATG
ncbi:hypothetical protein SESBI_30421 [Sesbania bispinosa]|nr:hypothetical protein SESBI_30421 [Sesbania bispinosa]